MPDPKPTRKPGIVMKDLGRETILYDHAGEAVHILNPTAKLIWGLCDGQHTLADIESALRSSFSVPAGYDLIGDIRKTLQVFSGKGLLSNDT